MTTAVLGVGGAGGVKQSGPGREGAHHGLMEVLEPKYVVVDW